ncbi:hypothetical protein R5R35_009879 [Gryllus longicercus]|uniref:G-protein coupled receptor 143 n=1 Tax=Gryllus longicercus TaxID=2509291 RepID=A0AAN9VZL8_9ORTH
MADPTIQTFCCHWPNITYSSVKIMREFNSTSYNIVCVISSFIGILGALYQVLPKTSAKIPHRWQTFSALRGRQIVIWLAIADFLASIGVFTRSTLWLNLQSIVEESDDTSNVLICAITSAWIQYFYTATWLWTLCYAIDMRLVLKEKEGHPTFYHVVAWTVPAILTSLGLLVLYFPDANCHNLNSLSSALFHILPNYFATYVPIAVVMIANPVLYMSSSQDVERLISMSFNQFTSKERELVDAIKLKFCLINFVFYFCWLPNILNGILLWTLWFNLPESIIIGLWYVMAVTNPLQALCNSLVYRRWSGTADKLYIPCRRQISTTVLPESDDSPPVDPWPNSPEVHERTPLLQSHEYNATTSRSVNGVDPVVN